MTRVGGRQTAEVATEVEEKGKRGEGFFWGWGGGGCNVSSGWNLNNPIATDSDNMYLLVFGILMKCLSIKVGKLLHLRNKRICVTIFFT